MQPPAFFSRTYDETMDLMVEARNYMSYVERRERERASAFVGLRMSCEAMRVTSRLTQVMAWLLMQRAVHQGEVSVEQALADDCQGCSVLLMLPCSPSREAGSGH